MGYTPHILVVGGGATGTGVARDLAMRGFEVTLVERGKLTDGATGRMDGLLHSGARYANTDPAAARECLAERRTLEAIAAHCVVDTGGLFVSLEGDDEEYFERTRAGCEDVGMDARVLSGEEVEDLEPSLTPEVDRAFRVPDATVDPFRLTVATARSARNYGATVETHTPVTDLLVENDAVAGVEVAPRDGTGTRELDADYVVNAAGAWAGDLAGMAGLDVPVGLSKAGMVVVSESPTDRVVSRCCSQQGGNTIVPYAGRCILGTTGDDVDDPDVETQAQHDVDRLVDGLAAVAPELGNQRPIRAYCGVQPYHNPQQPDARTETGGATGRFSLIDHEERDDTWGLTTVVGGTVTTHRLVAEAVADHVCAKFGIDRACLTATEPLPGSEREADTEDKMEQFGLASAVVEAGRDRLGSRASEVLETSEPNPVLCDCENVTRTEVRDALDDETAARTDLDEVRVRTRAGMGTCQGGRCCHALASELYPTEPIEAIDGALDDLCEARWSGQRHVLWGEQLAQAMRNYNRHARALNRGREHLDLDLSAFDSGPEWDEDDLNPRGGGFRP